MSKKKRQFKGTSKAKDHYDRKVIHSRTGRTLSLTKVIPKDWLYVRIYLVDETKNHKIIGIQKLMGVEQAAQITATHKGHKPDTP